MKKLLAWSDWWLLSKEKERPPDKKPVYAGMHFPADSIHYPSTSRLASFLPLAILLVVTVLSVIAQSAAEYPKLYEFGLPGIVIAWFMFRWERFANRQISSTDRLGHKFDGVQRAMILMELNRGNCNPNVNRVANEMLAELDANKRAQEKEKT